MSSLHLSAVIYNLSRDIRADLQLRVMDGQASERASAHTTRALPVRIREVHTSDKIPELHFVWNCNFAGFTYGPSPLPARSPGHPLSPSYPFHLFRCLSTSGVRARAQRALYQHECARICWPTRGERRYISTRGVSLGKQQSAAGMMRIFSRKIHSKCRIQSCQRRACEDHRTLVVPVHATSVTQRRR